MKRQIQEEAFNITGWQDHEEKIFQSGFYLKRHNQQQAEQLRKKETPPLSKIPFREHRRHKTKEVYQSKKSEISNLREDKQQLQRYLWAQNEPQLNTSRNNCQQQSLPAKRILFQTEVMHTKLEKLRENRITENDERVSKQYNSILDKYTLFSGLKAQLAKKRRFLLRTQSKENIPQQKIKTDLLALQFDLNNSKFMLEKIDKSKEFTNNLGQIRKKKLKFPLYFRELTSKQQKKTKFQPNYTFNFQKSLQMTRTAQFMDDNIFSSKNIAQ